MNRNVVLEILRSLESEYSKNWSYNELKVKLRNWVAVLKDVTDKQGLAGLEKALKDQSDFMPSVGKFRQMCLSGAGCLSLEDEAREAWSFVRNNINSSITPVFKDTCITETINKMGGWIAFCYSLTEYNEAYKQKEFINLYIINKNSGKRFSPLPDRTIKIMQNGKEQPCYRFIGFNKDDDLRPVLAEMENIAVKDHALLNMITRSAQTV